MKRVRLISVFVFVFVILLLTPDLFSWIPQTIDLLVPGTEGFDDEAFLGRNTQSYGWNVWRNYIKWDAGQEGSVIFEIYHGWDQLVFSETDIEDLTITGRNGAASYKDCSNVDIEFHEEYYTCLTVESNMPTWSNNHARISNCEIPFK